MGVTRVRKIHTGPSGGKYVIRSGRKCYLKRSTTRYVKRVAHTRYGRGKKRKRRVVRRRRRGAGRVIRRRRPVGKRRVYRRRGRGFFGNLLKTGIQLAGPALRDLANQGISKAGSYLTGRFGEHAGGLAQQVLGGLAGKAFGKLGIGMRRRRRGCSYRAAGYGYAGMGMKRKRRVSSTGGYRKRRRVGAAPKRKRRVCTTYTRGVRRHKRRCPVRRRY